MYMHMQLWMQVLLSTSRWVVSYMTSVQPQHGKGAMLTQQRTNIASVNSIASSHLLSTLISATVPREGYALHALDPQRVPHVVKLTTLVNLTQQLHHSTEADAPEVQQTAAALLDLLTCC
jgi:hypothetical protein